MQLGPGTVTLGGGNLYSGGTTIAGGVLQLGNPASLGTGGLAAGGGTLDLNGISATVGDLTGATGVITTLNGLATLTVGTSNSTVYSGTIVDSGTNQASLTKNGAGALTLLGNNSYSGTTTVNGGTLALGNGGGAPPGSGELLGPVALNNNSTLLVNRADDVDFTATISGTGSLVKMGAGTLTLEGTDTYSGGTIIRNGTLLVIGNEAIADGTNVTVGNPAAFSAIMPSSAAPAAAVVPEPGSAALAAAGVMIVRGCVWRAHSGSAKKKDVCTTRHKRRQAMSIIKRWQRWVRRATATRGSLLRAGVRRNACRASALEPGHRLRSFEHLEPRLMLEYNPFVHPGILSTAADFSRMQTEVAAQAQPWYSAYQALTSDAPRNWAKRRLRCRRSSAAAPGRTLAP